MKELLLSYANGKVTAIQVIRALSGIFNPDHAVAILSIICAITRVEEGDMAIEDFKSVFKLEQIKEGEG